jgi:hypothetical protein
MILALAVLGPSWQETRKNPEPRLPGWASSLGDEATAMPLQTATFQDPTTGQGLSAPMFCYAKITKRMSDQECAAGHPPVPLCGLNGRGTVLGGGQTLKQRKTGGARPRHAHH